ncbi:hypothetical protein TNCV_3733251 [Trichonephila clavipes]|nr:hypothetical protein TNCV_3733251 [Trichonephila clavipes]
MPRRLEAVISAKGGHSNLVVKVTDSWPVCHEFEPSTAENMSFRGGQCTPNRSRFKRSPMSGVCKLEEVVPSQVSSSSLDHGLK